MATGWQRVGPSFRTLILWVLALAISAQERQVPLGHPDFYPSPERPVGWHGDGNGAFPGATPIQPFSQGPVKEIVEDYLDGKKKKQRKYYQIVEDKPKNIAWMVDLPSWTHSQPVIIGDRVVVTCEPDLVLCYDMHNGKELWRHRLDPLGIDGVDAKTAAGAYLIRDCHDAITGLLCELGFYGYGRLPTYTPEVKAKCDRYSVLLKGLVEKIATVDPQLGATLAKGVAEYDRLRSELKPGVDWKGQKHISKFVTRALGDTLIRYLDDKYQLTRLDYNHAFVGRTWPAPVSDGESVYVTMTDNQVARIGLDGKVRWQRRFPQDKVGKKRRETRYLATSPVLIGSRLIMDFHRCIVAFDMETGKQLWTAGNPKEGSLTDCMALVKVRMANGRDLLVRVRKAGIFVFDPKDGRKLWELAGKKSGLKFSNDDGGSPLTCGDILVCPNGAVAVRFAADGDQVTGEVLWRLTGGNGMGTLILHDGKAYLSKLTKVYDVRSGKVIGGLPKVRPHYHYPSPSLIGDRILVIDGGRSTPEGHIWARHSILGIDGKIISTKNDLGYPIAPAPRMEALLPEPYRQRELSGRKAIVPDMFTHGSAAFACGNRTVLSSTGRLYCIGDPKQPYNWNPASRPKEIAAALRD